MQNLQRNRNRTTKGRGTAPPKTEKKIFRDTEKEHLETGKQNHHRQRNRTTRDRKTEPPETEKQNRQRQTAPPETEKQNHQ
ncbi:Hypothetical predicted protein, partial [Pelobates cultripes]